MNYFIEGIQGAGKSTLVARLAEKLPGYRVFHEGDYSPVELAWCAYLTKEQYEYILEKYTDIAEELKNNTTIEPDYKNESDKRYVLTYTRVITDIPGFHKDLEQYEIYNNRIKREEFEEIIMSRFGRWNGHDQIFECSIFQNIVEDQILYYEMPDEEILDFYRRLKLKIDKQDFRIIYLDVADVAEGLSIIRKERVDNDGNEMWYPLMMEYLKNSPYGIHHGWKDFDDLVRHLEHRKSVELRILKEVFPGQAVILRSKEYDLEELLLSDMQE